MSPAALLSLVAISAALVSAQNLEPLASKTFTWPNIPYQVTGDNGGIRGPQWGYNLCNSTTENQQSLCQTAFLNNLADFCMWSSSETNDTVGESEAREVAWCTSPGHGTRIIPPGAITGAQWLYAKDYVQVVGFIDQTQVGLAASDQGGELDPHGADEQGNPLGGIVYTNGFGMHAADFNSLVTSGGNFTANQTYTQVIEWIDFIGGGTFCMKMCNPSDPDAPNLCNHIYDEVGCTYNALANYNDINGTFTVCDSDDMADPGFYTLPNGQTTQWHQPFSGPITPIPYTPTVPPSSNCFTYSSDQLFKAAATDTAAFPSLTAASAQATGSGASGSGAATSRSGSGSTPSQTGGSNSNTSGAASAFSLGATTFVAASVLTTLVTMASMLA